MIPDSKFLAWLIFHSVRSGSAVLAKAERHFDLLSAPLQDDIP